VLACNLSAISASARPRYNELIGHLRAGIHERNELPDGYAFQLNEQCISLLEIAEWIGMERLCCPFLTFQLETNGEAPGFTLRLTGPAGVKTILETEFPPVTPSNYPARTSAGTLS